MESSLDKTELFTLDEYTSLYASYNALYLKLIVDNFNESHNKARRIFHSICAKLLTTANNGESIQYINLRNYGCTPEDQSKIYDLISDTLIKLGYIISDCLIQYNTNSPIAFNVSWKITDSCNVLTK